MERSSINVLPLISMQRKVLNVLRNMKVDKSPAPNQIYLIYPWEVREEIAGELGEMYNSLLDSDTVQKCWKVANVVLLLRRALRKSLGTLD